MGRASLVLARAAGSTARTGVLHAHLATAWVHLDRGELVRTRQYLDRAADECGGNQEPWLVAVQRLVEARLLTAGGEPEAAIRLLARAASTEPPGLSPWLADQLLIASAEALLAAGEPQRALAMITPEPALAAVEAGVLTASARCDIGDMRGARAALASVVADLPCASLGCQVESWLLEARLAKDEGDAERAHLLVDRALRAAAAEELRRPFAGCSVWLRAFVDRDVLLRRTHRAFLASLPTAGSAVRRGRVEPESSAALIVDSLTEREVEVLDLLAQMCSTDEIADELYVSVNTVKTHLKGIFRKLCVSRRVDAVRRGRELGLC
jgi:LuxR family maltose regulon positive regulatory protein